MSEPETRFLNDQVERFQPQLVVSIHAPYGVLDFDGPVTPPRQLGALRLERVGVFPGSLGDMWADLLRWMDARLPSDVREASGKTGPAS